VAKIVGQQQIRVKVETTYNVDAAPASTDALIVSAFNWKFAEANLAERPISTGTKLGAPSIYAGALVELTFDVELKGSGAAGTAPDIGPALRACGFLETITGGVSVAYKLDSDDEKSATIWFKDGDPTGSAGDEWRLTGCRGSVVFNMEAGNFGIASFTMRGHVGQEPTSTAAWTQTVETTIPVPLLAVPLVIGGVTMEQSKISVDPALELAQLQTLNAADGYGEIRITRARPKVSATVVAPAVATADPVGDFRAGTTRTLSMVAVGGTAGNRYQFTFPGGGKYEAVEPGDDNGIITYDMTLAILEAVIGDDAPLTLTFT
jgi:hypothetical protein